MAVANAYQLTREYQLYQTANARPTQLVLMLYDGAIRFLSLAREKMISGDLEVRHTFLLKAQRILSELMGSLDMEQGGEVAANLQRVYAFMLHHLVEANLYDRPENIEEVIRMLRDLRDSWAQIDQQVRREQIAAESAHEQ